MAAPAMSCTQMIYENVLEPGEAVEELEILNPPTKGFTENHYVQVNFRKGSLGDTSSTPIEINLPIK